MQNNKVVKPLNKPLDLNCLSHEDRSIQDEIKKIRGFGSFHHWELLNDAHMQGRYDDLAYYAQGFKTLYPYSKGLWCSLDIIWLRANSKSKV